MGSRMISSFPESREDGMGLYMATKLTLLGRIAESLEKIVKLVEEANKRDARLEEKTKGK